MTRRTREVISSWETADGGFRALLRGIEQPVSVDRRYEEGERLVLVEGAWRKMREDAA